jgi:hypothetical protein
VAPEQGDGRAEAAHRDAHLVHALGLAVRRRGVVGDQVGERRADDPPEALRRAEAAGRSSAPAFRAAARRLSPACGRARLAFDGQRERHGAVEVEGQAVERAGAPGLQLQFQLLELPPRGPGGDRPLVDGGLDDRVGIGEQEAAGPPDVGHEGGPQPSMAAPFQRLARRRVGDEGQVRFVALDRPFPLAAGEGRAPALRRPLHRLDAGVAAAPDAQADPAPSQGQVRRVEVGRHLAQRFGRGRLGRVEGRVGLQPRLGLGRQAEPELGLQRMDVLGVGHGDAARPWWMQWIGTGRQRGGAPRDPSTRAAPGFERFEPTCPPGRAGGQVGSAALPRVDALPLPPIRLRTCPSDVFLGAPAAFITAGRSRRSHPGLP